MYLTLQDELQVQQNQQKVRLSQFFTLPYLRRALFVSVVLHLAQQLSGIGGVSGAEFGTKVCTHGVWNKTE